MKNVLIGEPSGWIRGSRINVFFPHMPLAKSTSEQYLSEVELRDWVDRILLPSLHASVGADVAHHHPRSWAAALADSKVRQELNPRSHSANMANKHNVPCEHLGRLWDEIRQRCDSLQIGPRKPFKAPVLLLYQHGSKGLYKADSVRAAMRKYRRELEAAYDLRHFAASAYFDIGTEYFSEQAVTLLWKTQCIEKMRDTIQATAVKVGDGTTRISTWDQYLWCLCADAATVQYTISGSSMLFRSGLAHAQVYNIDKNIFSTQIKNYGPFGAKQLHRLGLADDAKHGHQKGYRSKTKLQFSQQKIAKSCIQTAQRVFKQLKSTRDGSYGVRQEVRVSLRKAFEWLDRQPDGDEKEAAPVTPADGEHRAFWVLRTDEVSRFRLRAVERWVWPIYAAASRALVKPSSSLSQLSREVRLRNSGTVACCVTVLQYMFAGQIRKDSAVWKDRMAKLKKKRNADGEYDDDGELENDDSGDEGEPHGLDLENMIAQHGTAWLPRWKFDALATPPVLRRECFEHAALIKRTKHLAHTQRTVLDRAGRREKRGPNAQENEDRRIAILHAALRTVAPGKSLRLAAQLVVQAYARDVFFEVYKRWRDTDKTADDAERRHRKRTDFETWLEAWMPDREERLGLWGLDVRIVGQITGLDENTISRPKPPSSGWTRLLQNRKWETRLMQYLPLELQRLPGWRSEWRTPAWASRQQFYRTFCSVRRAYVEGIEARKDIPATDPKIWLEVGTGECRLSRAVLHEAAKCLWVVVASNADEWSPIKSKPDQPTFKRTCFASVGWDFDPRRLQPAEASLRCKAAVKSGRTTLATSGPRATVWAGPKPQQRREHFGWRKMALAAAVEEALQEWHDYDLADGEDGTGRVDEYVARIFET